MHVEYTERTPMSKYIIMFNKDSDSGIIQVKANNKEHALNIICNRYWIYPKCVVSIKRGNKLLKLKEET